MWEMTFDGGRYLKVIIQCVCLFQLVLIRKFRKQTSVWEITVNTTENSCAIVSGPYERSSEKTGLTERKTGEQHSCVNETWFYRLNRTCLCNWTESKDFAYCVNVIIGSFLLEFILPHILILKKINAMLLKQKH